MSGVFTDIFEQLYEKLLKNFSFYTVIVILSLLYIIITLIKNPEKASLWSAAISRMFSRISSSASKHAIEKEINGRILGGVRNTSAEIGEILPYKVSFSWKEKSDRKSFFDSNQVVLFMDPSRTKTQNIIHALNDYVDEGLLPKRIDSTIDPLLSKAQKMLLTKKIVAKAYKEGLRYYIDNFFVIDSDDLKVKIDTLQRLDNDGLFIQVALRELCMFHLNNDISLIDSSFGKEYSNFIDFLIIVASRKRKEDTPLSFTGNFFKVGIILAASDITYYSVGNDAYVRRFEKYVDSGIKSVYIRSRGSKKNQISMDILKSIQAQFEILNYKEYKYEIIGDHGSANSGICIYIDSENVVKKS